MSIHVQTIQTVRWVGMNPIPTTVTVTVEDKPGAFHITGMKETSARETRIRCRSALQSSGVCIDDFGVHVEIPEPVLRLNGDLPIAMAVLAALGRITLPESPPLAIGDLSLTGDVRPVRGVLPSVRWAREQGFSAVLVPQSNWREASHIEGVRIVAIGSLEELASPAQLDSENGSPFEPGVSGVDMADLRGMHGAGRGIEIAAAGAHSVLLAGPAGSGHTMLARRLPTILPLLSKEEALELSALYSHSGLLPKEGILQTRPFRAPHHTVSAVGLVGGGDPIRAGEVSLAHGGVLFLDELPEFRRNVLEALFQSLHAGTSLIRRGGLQAGFPARPHLVAAMSGCPCGRCHTDDRVCSLERIDALYARLPRSLVSRMQMVIRTAPTNMASGPRGESSATIRARVNAARLRQMARFADGETSARTNAELTPKDLKRVQRAMNRHAHTTLREATNRLKLTMTDSHKLLGIVRTVADLEGADVIRGEHVSEALTWMFYGQSPFAELKARSGGSAEVS